MHCRILLSDLSGTPEEIAAAVAGMATVAQSWAGTPAALPVATLLAPIETGPRIAETKPEANERRPATKPASTKATVNRNPASDVDDIVNRLRPQLRQAYERQNQRLSVNSVQALMKAAGMAAGWNRCRQVADRFLNSLGSKLPASNKPAPRTGSVAAIPANASRVDHVLADQESREILDRLEAADRLSLAVVMSSFSVEIDQAKEIIRRYRADREQRS